MSRTAALLSALLIIGWSCSTPANELPLPQYEYRLTTQYGGANMTLNASGQSALLLSTKRLWKFASTPNSFYRLTTEVDDKTMCLDVYSDTYQAHLADCANYSGQFWRISFDRGWARLSTLFLGPEFCLDVYRDTYLAHLGRCANYSGQFWRLDRELVKTLICTHPVFTEERRLLATVDGSPGRTQYVGGAIGYLYRRYCRDIEEELQASDVERIGDNCIQYSGIFRGEKVYWGQCHE